MVGSKKKHGNIVIIGFMATGKTSIARELSDFLDKEYIDIDKLIEEKMKISIPKIFKIYGEKYFREIERDTIKEISRQRNIIISCGGGVCLDPENIINIRKSGKVILLEADAKSILERTKHDKSRPLLNDKKDIKDIGAIMKERKESYYKAADIIIDTSGKSLSSVRDEIMKSLKL